MHQCKHSIMTFASVGGSGSSTSRQLPRNAVPETLKVVLSRFPKKVLPLRSKHSATSPKTQHRAVSREGTSNTKATARKQETKATARKQETTARSRHCTQGSPKTTLTRNLEIPYIQKCKHHRIFRHGLKKSKIELVSDRFLLTFYID